MSTPVQSVDPAEISGIVFDIQRAALHDGPGIRTTVFLKGCPLRCKWCHNPESQSFEPQTGKGGKHYGSRMTAADVMRTVVRDRVFYETSGGGMTLSGGEPTAQYDFCRALLVCARQERIHSCLDTSGHLEPKRFREIAPLADCILFDFKAADDCQYRALTGVSNNWIQENLAWLGESGMALRLRCPLVPCINDSTEYFAALREQAARLKGLKGIDLLPYHTIGNSKYADVGLKLPLLDTHVPTDEDKNRWRGELEGVAAEVTVG